MINYQEVKTVMNQKTQNFLDLYFEAIDENIDEVVEELKSAGIDPEETQMKILYLIKEKKAELKIERGKRLKARVEELMQKRNDLPIEAESEKRLAIAARNLTELSEDDIATIKKDAALLDEMEKIIDGKKDEAGRTRS
ncbi:MAG TPA: hypothetical protein DHV28_15240 [Ignavibacteriales bacterium]|nr:hypothetical protein [Ignavibacteriales bacterium]